MQRTIEPLVLTSFVLLAAAAATAQDRFDHGMQKSHLPEAVLGGATGFAAVDVDGDGDLDLVAVHDQGQDRLWINDGNGRFEDQTAARLPIGNTRTSAVVAADVDGDGDPDLVLAAGSGQDRLYRNDGAGHFTDDTAASLPARNLFTRALAFADVDADGDLDLVLGQFSLLPSQSLLLANDGAGHFTDVTATALPAVPGITNVVLTGDFDGDGRVDLVLLGVPDQLLHNTGAGTFTSAAGLPAHPTLSSQVGAAGDLDRDGDLDLVVSFVFGIGVWRNDGSGSFTDVAASSLPPELNRPVALCLSDVDGDGDLDLAFGNTAALPDRVCWNMGNGVFLPFSSPLGEHEAQARTMLAADLDGDGTAELLIATAGLERFYHYEGQGRFIGIQRPRLLAGDAQATAGSFADLDGDGVADVVLVGESSPGVRVFLDDGQGSLAENLGATPSGSALCVGAGDLDGDGDVDLMVGLNGQNRWFRNDGTGSFTLGSALPTVNDHTIALALGDVDGDGDLDVVTGNLGQQDRLLRNDGAGGFVDATTASLPVLLGYTRGVALADVDGDRDLDLVLLSADQPLSPMRPRLFLNDGSGRFTEVTATQLPAPTGNTVAMLLADLDGDGDPDLYLANVGVDQLLRNDGTGHFQEPMPPSLPQHDEYTYGVAAGDVDRDGDLDLLVSTGTGARLFRNDGGLVFVEEAASLPAELASARRLAFTDVDRDEDVDLLLVRPNGVALMLANRRAQVAAPWLALAGRPYELHFACRPGEVAANRLAIAAMGWAMAPAPLSVPPLGTFLLAPSALLDLVPWTLLGPASGEGTFAFTVPGGPILLGQFFAVQALIVDPSGNGTHLTNAVTDVVRR